MHFNTLCSIFGSYLGNNKILISRWFVFVHCIYILDKSENATLLLLVKMAEKYFSFQSSDKKILISRCLFLCTAFIYWTKVKTLHFCFWSKLPKSFFNFNFFFCKIKCLKSSYYLCCTCVLSK